MLFHVITRSPSQRTEVNQRPAAEPAPTLMPRYHYSKLVNSPENNNNNTETTTIPLRTSAGAQREFIPIPITRENGTTITTLPMHSRSVPFTYLSEDEGAPHTSFISLLRPSSRYFHHQPPGLSRHASLTLPVLTSVSKTDENQFREIPIRFPSANSRTSSAVLRPDLQRQKSDTSSTSLLNITIPSQPSSDFTVSSPIRRAEVMAREAIEHLARLQYEQRNQTALSNARSPSTSRRVIINLQNSPSVSLERRLKSPAPPAREKNNLHIIPVLQEIQLVEAPTTNSHANSSNYKNEFQIEIPVTITSTTNNNDDNEQENQEDERNYPLKSILKRSSSRDAVTRKNVSFLNV